MGPWCQNFPPPPRAFSRALGLLRPRLLLLSQNCPRRQKNPFLFIFSRNSYPWLWPLGSSPHILRFGWQNSFPGQKKAIQDLSTCLWLCPFSQKNSVLREGKARKNCFDFSLFHTPNPAADKLCLATAQCKNGHPSSRCKFAP